MYGFVAGMVQRRIYVFSDDRTQTAVAYQRSLEANIGKLHVKI